MSEQFDCTGTSYPVCPHCGHEHTDIGEWQSDSNGGLGQCENEACGKWFRWSVEYDPHFYTEKSCDPDKHQWLGEVYYKQVAPGKDRVDYRCTICRELEVKIEDSKPETRRYCHPSP